MVDGPLELTLGLLGQLETDRLDPGHTRDAVDV